MLTALYISRISRTLVENAMPRKRITLRTRCHFQRLKAESSAPSCVTCHKPHSFKVMKASELIPLCSVCHNQKNNIAIASVPQDAKKALEKQAEFQDELLKAKSPCRSESLRKAFYF